MKVYDCYPTYLGCKRSLAVDIVSKIKEMYPNTKTIVDAFGGSGAISITAIQMGLNALYNEKTERVARAIKYLANGNFDDITTFMSYDEYWDNIISNNTLNDSDCFKVSFMYNFTGRGNCYIIPDDEFKNFRILLQKFVCKDSDPQLLYPFLNDNFHSIINELYSIEKPIIERYNDIMPIIKKLVLISKHNLYQYFNASIDELKKISFKMLQNIVGDAEAAYILKMCRIYPIEKITFLRNHKHIDFSKMEISNKDAFDLDLSKYDPETTVLYFDPPYKNTAKSGNYTDFDSNTLPLLFDKFKQFPIFLSEYSSNIEGLQEIYTKSIPHFNGKEYAKEVLYFKSPLR
ncbi:hypothetical protein [Campylobacter phage CJLB-7]|nr:hypothetical protein [Campylobacter phage CJLB-7]